jgi:hypothetical protein
VTLSLLLIWQAPKIPYKAVGLHWDQLCP